MVDLYSDTYIFFFYLKVGIFVSVSVPGSEAVATLAGRVHPDYRRSGTKDLLYMSGGERIRATNPNYTLALYDALKSKYWDKMIPASKATPSPITLETKWVIIEIP